MGKHQIQLMNWIYHYQLHCHLSPIESTSLADYVILCVSKKLIQVDQLVSIL